MKPGLIRKFFIYYRIERLLKREILISTRLKKFLEMQVKSYEAQNLVVIAANICADELAIIQAKKKNLYFKLM